MSNRLFQISVFIITMIGCYFAISGIFFNYSYWWDELYSVTSASLPVSEMMDILMSDVHPPLYQMVLRLWISVFGDSEVATRSLSLFFSLSVLVIVTYWAYRRLNSIAAGFVVVFFSTCYLFSFYAQESRAYAMMLFLSTLLTVMYLEYAGGAIKLKPLLAMLSVAILLSLSHYFGFLYSGVIIIFLLCWCYRDAKRAFAIIFSGMVCLVWPVVHFAFGEIEGKGGGDFWIQSDGFESTLTILSHGLIPQFLVARNIVYDGLDQYAVSLLFSAAFFVVFFYGFKAIKKSGDLLDRKAAFFSLYAIFLFFVVVVVLVDYHTPISTNRNFIVLLPTFAVLLGLATSELREGKEKLALFFIMIVGFFNLSETSDSMADKQAPLQAHRDAARFIENHTDTGEEIYFLARRGNIPLRAQKLVAEFYFKEGRLLSGVAFEDIGSLDPPYYILMQHQQHDIPGLVKELSKNDSNAKYYEPEQTSASPVVVVYANSKRSQ